MVLARSQCLNQFVTVKLDKSVIKYSIDNTEKFYETPKSSTH